VSDRLRLLILIFGILTGVFHHQWKNNLPHYKRLFEKKEPSKEETKLSYQGGFGNYDYVPYDVVDGETIYPPMVTGDTIGYYRRK